MRRWSERKTQVRAREKLPASSDPPANEPVPPMQANEPVQPLSDADMPPIDTLDEKSDYKGFLSPEVSENLRRLALRKLFHLPAFNIRDGLDDYDEDFKTFVPVGNIVTAHERHQQELQRQEDQERLAQEKAAEKAAPSASDGGAAEGSSKDEQPADETASVKSEDTEDFEEDGDSPRHG